MRFGFEMKKRKFGHSGLYKDDNYNNHPKLSGNSLLIESLKEETIKKVNEKKFGPKRRDCKYTVIGQSHSPNESKVKETQCRTENVKNEYLLLVHLIFFLCCIMLGMYNHTQIKF